MTAVVRQARKWRLLEVATVWAALALSSCAFFADGGATTPPATEAPAESPAATLAPAAPPRPVRKPSPPPAQPPTGQPPAGAEETVDPEHVIGLDEGETAGWLGEPSQRTDAPPATIWRYLSSDCQIDVYFYLDLQSGVMRALHYEVRSEEIVERRPERCFRQLVGERRQRDSSSAAYRPR